MGKRKTKAKRQVAITRRDVAMVKREVGLDKRQVAITKVENGKAERGKTDEKSQTA